MRLTASDLKELGIIEQVIPEPESYTTETMETVREELDAQIQDFLKTYTGQDVATLTEARYARFRKM